MNSPDSLIVPSMARAKALPGLETADPTDDMNSYPTILVDGVTEVIVDDWTPSAPSYTPVSVASDLDSLTWLTADQKTDYITRFAKGYWSGTFAMPDTYDNTEQYLELWWSMGCGNDGVYVSMEGLNTPHGQVPLPGALALCAVGIGFAGIVRVLRRRSR